MTKRLRAFFADFWQQTRENFWGALVGASLSAVVGWGLFTTALGQKLVFRSYDLPFSIRSPIHPTEAVVVYMDETSHSVLKQPFNAPWDRSLHGKLVNRLTAAGAKTVAFDIVFAGPSPDYVIDTNVVDGGVSDKVFADAIKANGHVVLAADNVPVEVGGGQKANQTVHPYELFEANTAGVGSAEMFPDDDLVIRQHLPETPKDEIFTLSWVTAEVVGAKITQDPHLHFKERWCNYYGPDKTLPSISYFQVILDEEFDALPSGFFSNKVVFVGARTFTKFSNERKDAYPTPFPNQDQGNKFMPGVEIQATVFLNLLREDWLNRLSRPTEQKIILLVGILSGVGLILCRPWIAAAVAIGIITVVFFGNYYFFVHHRYWFPWMIVVVAQIPAALIWSVTFNSVRLYVANKLLEQSLGKYVSPKRVKQMINRREVLAPGAEKQMLTILFSDIENFTVLSEGVDSGELAKLMNNYFEGAVTDCIFKTDGTVVKYIGDAIFSFWNAPEDQSDHAVRACEAALLLSTHAISIDKGGNQLHCRTRVGLHTGVANVGNFGSATRIDYTAIGENINLASRMEGLNKYLGTSVLITGETKASVPDDRLVMRSCGKFILKGFEKIVDVYELVGMPSTANESKPWRDAFAQALKDFQQKNFDAAEAGFHCVEKLHPNDGPSHFYLKTIKELRNEPPGPDWQGEVELKDK